MKPSTHWNHYLPYLIGTLLVLGFGAFLFMPREGGPSLAERIVEHYGGADRDADRDRDTDRDREKAAAARPSEEKASSPAPSVENGAEAREKDQGAPGVVAFTPEGLQLAGLRIETVGYRSVRSRLALTGTVEANLSGVVKVTPRVAGKITTVLVNVGSAVRAGQPLATMTSTDLAQGQAAYRQAAARVAVAQDNLQRQKKLASLGTYARPSLEAARNQAATAQADVQTAEADVATAQAGIDQAQSQLQVLQTALAQAQTQAQVAQSRFNRSDLLLKAEIVSRQDWEATRADYQNAQADVKAARAKIGQGQSGIETAKATLAAAQAKLDAAKRRSQIAAQALSREQTVYQGGYATSQQIVTAQATLRQAQLDQRAAADNVRLLGGRVSRALPRSGSGEGRTLGGDGDRLTVTAPIAGDVTERLVTLGQSVAPSDMLFTIINLRTVWVQLNAYPNDVPAIRVGQAVAVASDTAPGHMFTGSVSYVSDIVDPTTHTVKVRCVIRNTDDLLKPGTFVRGTIAAGGRTQALVVPRNAVQQLNGQSVVFVPTDKPGEFLACPVEVGAPFGPWVEIRAGLAPGDRVVTRNAFLVKSQALKSQLGDEDEDQDKGDQE